MSSIRLPRAGNFLGRARVAGKAHPLVVTVRDQQLFDITSRAAPTVRDVCELADPTDHVRSASGTAIGTLADIAGNSFEANRDLAKPYLLVARRLAGGQGLGRHIRREPAGARH